MQESRISTKNIFRILIALLVVAVGIFVLQIASRGKITTPRTPVTPTEAPEVSFEVDIPQKALWKNYFIVSAKAAPGAICDLFYVPPMGESQEMTSVADEDGKCTWRWKIDESQGKGNGRLIITIDGRSETHFFEIRSSF